MHKLLKILFMLVSVAGTAQAASKSHVQRYTNSPPTSPSTGAYWCVASPDALFKRVRKAVQWACKNGADCSAIRERGPCYYHDNLYTQASYIFNDYYQKNPVPSSCNFDQTAELTTKDPSTATCKIPSKSTGPIPLVPRPPSASSKLGGFSWGFMLTCLLYIAAQIA